MSPLINPFRWPQPGGIGVGNCVNGTTGIQNISQNINHTGINSFTDTTTITTVDTSRTLIFPKWTTTYAYGGTGFGMGGVRLTSATAVTWTTYVSAAAACNVTLYADVVEFSNPFKSIQYVQGGATTRTINAVNTAKTFILALNWDNTGSNHNIQATLSDATTVAISNGAATGATNLYWVVVELY